MNLGGFIHVLCSMIFIVNVIIGMFLEVIHAWICGLFTLFKIFISIFIIVSSCFIELFTCFARCAIFSTIAIFIALMFVELLIKCIFNGEKSKLIGIAYFVRLSFYDVSFIFDAFIVQLLVVDFSFLCLRKMRIMFLLILFLC